MFSAAEGVLPRTGIWCVMPQRWLLLTLLAAPKKKLDYSAGKTVHQIVNFK